VSQLYPIQRRQRKPGAFPAAEALRAAKAAALVAAPVLADPPAVIEPLKISPPEQAHEDAADY
jgi:hypothetical protein